NRRGRQPGEVVALIEQGIRDVPFGRARETTVILDEVAATEYALSVANPGDVLAVMGEDMPLLAETLRAAAYARA
ncbi:MAG TPA: hypothetical protein PLT68_03540, partial [Actinomycetota bacterium]|nr:hypothetical protein [Actinomycetota bacterium]